jgi:hypothetical protein
MRYPAWLPFILRALAVVSTAAACSLPSPSAAPPAPAVVQRELPAPSASLPAPAVIRNESVSRPPNEPALPRPQGRLVDAFDRLIQARFEDVRAVTFGVNRLSRLGPRHQRVFEPKDDIERLSLQGIREAGWTTAIYVVEPRSREDRPGGVKGPVDTGRHQDLRILCGDLAIESLATRSMADKSPARGMIGSQVAEARPVLASAKTCLRCHSDRNLGDPLGAVVYTFLADPEAVLTKP